VKIGSIGANKVPALSARANQSLGGRHRKTIVHSKIVKALKPARTKAPAIWLG
jgi:hypothetical protein